MKVVVESVLPCDADAAWDEVRTSRLFHEVAAPLITVRPADADALPDRWPAGETVRVRSYLFGVVPLGTRVLHYERIDPAAREIQTRETDPLVRVWDHLIAVRPVGPGACRYRDEIDIRAGWLTPAVWVFAQYFYRHRQRRWQTVARRLAGARPSIIS